MTSEKNVHNAESSFRVFPQMLFTHEASKHSLAAFAKVLATHIRPGRKASTNSCFPTLVEESNQCCISLCEVLVVCRSFLLYSSPLVPVAFTRSMIDLSTGMDICTSARKTVPAGALNKSTGDAGIWSADTGVWEASSDCLPYVTGTASEPLQALTRMDVSKVIKDGQSVCLIKNYMLLL
jgi:hypothetical protein